jgi:hypothetical protein
LVRPVPAKFEPVPIQHIEASAETLAACVEKLSRAVQIAKEGELDALFLMWNKRHTDAIRMISGLGTHALSLVDEQVLDKKLGRPSRPEEVRARSAKEVERQRRKRAEAGIAPKKRGRPRKTP